MRCRSEATKTKRCAVGKNEAMRCRFALRFFLDIRQHSFLYVRESGLELACLEDGAMIKVDNKPPWSSVPADELTTD